MNYEKYGISRNDALKLLDKYIQNKNLIKHCLATEAVMKALAKKMEQDEDKWGLAGLLHDLDVETQPDLTVHTSETVQILTEKGVTTEVIDAIRMHNEMAHEDKRKQVHTENIKLTLLQFKTVDYSDCQKFVPFQKAVSGWQHFEFQTW